MDLDLPSLRFGRVSAASGGPVAITLNKAVAPAVEHKLRPVMRAAGRPHFTISADPALEDEADGPDEVDLDGAAGDGAGGDGGGGVAPGPAGGGAVPAEMAALGRNPLGVGLALLWAHRGCRWPLLVGVAPRRRPARGLGGRLRPLRIWPARLTCLRRPRLRRPLRRRCGRG